jgi:hypothetical protein
MTNVAHDFCGEIACGAEDASGNEVTLDFTKPDFDLVEPGGVGRRVVEDEIRIGLEKFSDPFGFVSREVIDNSVNGFSGRLGRDQFTQKGDKLSTGVTRGSFAKDLAVLGFQRGVKRQSAVAEVFETMSLCSTRRKGQYRIKSVQSLNRALFIHAEDRRVDRRLEIEPNDIGRFGLEIGVVARHVMAQTVRLEPGSGPHPRYACLICAERFGQSARAPLRGAVRGFAMQSPVNDACRKFLASRPRLPAAMATKESRESFGDKALPPQSYGIDAALLLRAEPAQRCPTGQSQNNTRTATVLTSRASALGQSLQSSSLRWANHKSSGHTNDNTSTVSEFNDSLH